MLSHTLIRPIDADSWSPEGVTSKNLLLNQGFVFVFISQDFNCPEFQSRDDHPMSSIIFANRNKR